MAKKRMFTRNVIDTDAFLGLPPTAQNLYFHLNMRADDEGFINNTLSIMSLCKAKKSDLQKLIEKKFIIDFGDVVVIKHWKMHNNIRADRTIGTNYTEHREKLYIKNNGSYSLKDKEKTTKCQPNVSQKDDTMSVKCQSVCQENDSIDKIRSDKISIDKYRLEENSISLLDNIEKEDNKNSIYNNISEKDNLTEKKSTNPFSDDPSYQKMMKLKEEFLKNKKGTD